MAPQRIGSVGTASTHRVPIDIRGFTLDEGPDAISRSSRGSSYRLPDGTYDDWTISASGRLADGTRVRIQHELYRDSWLLTTADGRVQPLSRQEVAVLGQRLASLDNPEARALAELAQVSASRGGVSAVATDWASSLVAGDLYSHGMGTGPTLEEMLYGAAYDRYGHWTGAANGMWLDPRRGFGEQHDFTAGALGHTGSLYDAFLGTLAYGGAPVPGLPAFSPDWGGYPPVWQP